MREACGWCLVADLGVTKYIIRKQKGVKGLKKSVTSYNKISGLLRNIWPFNKILISNF
jgi:hypothetical protein